jgi:acetoin utilization deacetylase AcuC-like enzyme
MTKAAEVLLVDDVLFEQHASSSNHPERPARLAAARAGVQHSGVATRRMDPVDATRAQLVAVHTADYLDSLERLRGVRGMIDPDTYVAPKSIEAALRAAGGAGALGAALARKESLRGVALVRPPGHHAEADRAMGFCLLNNVAVAAAAAREAGARRVAIVDIDVHHGNGTQDIFWRDPDVLYASLHQWPFYPGTGAVDERGEGAGLGTTINVPLSEGAGDDVYREAMRRVIGPALRKFDADVVLVSGGFDAFEHDPLASMLVTPAGFASIVAHIGAVAGDRPLGLVLEGGYDLAGLEACMAAATRALVDDGHVDAAQRAPGATHQHEIDRAAVAQDLD